MLYFVSQHDMPAESSPRWALATTKSLFTYAIKHRFALSTSIATQAISSLTNFAIALVLLRILPEADYGLYALGVAACYLFGGLGNSLLLTQMVIHLPRRALAERPPYAARILCWATALGVAAVLLTLAFALAIRLAFPGFPHLRLLVVSSIAAGAYLLKDFFVRHAYASQAERRALAVTFTVGASTVALLAVTWVLRLPLDATGALGLFAASQCCGAATGFASSALPWKSVSWRHMKADIREAWQGGRWALSSSAMWWAHSQAYAYLTAAALGPAATGRANAARVLLSPFMLLLPSVNQILLPRLSALAAQDPTRTIALGIASSATLTLAGALYSCTLIGFSHTLAPIVLGSRYVDIRPLVIAWSFVLLGLLARDGASTLLQATKHFRALSVANVVAVVVSIPTAIVLMTFWGTEGAVLGGATAELVAGALLWRLVFRSNRGMRASDTPPRA